MAGDVRESEFSVVSAPDVNGDRSYTVVSLAGQAGIATCGWVRMILEQQAERGQDRLVVDLSRLSAMDWWVALMLTWAGRVFSRRGGVLVLASPQPAVARLLDAAGAPKVIAVCNSVQQAEDGVAACPWASA